VYVKLKVLLCVFGIVMKGLFSTEISFVLFGVMNTVSVLLLKKLGGSTMNTGVKVVV
jgi:hypothetical protein